MPAHTWPQLGIPSIRTPVCGPLPADHSPAALLQARPPPAPGPYQVSPSSPRNLTRLLLAHLQQNHQSPLIRESISPGILPYLYLFFLNCVCAAAHFPGCSQKVVLYPTNQTHYSSSPRLIENPGPLCCQTNLNPRYSPRAQRLASKQSIASFVIGRPFLPTAETPFRFPPFLHPSHHFATPPRPAHFRIAGGLSSITIRGRGWIPTFFTRGGRTNPVIQHPAQTQVPRPRKWSLELSSASNNPHPYHRLGPFRYRDVWASGLERLLSGRARAAYKRVVPSQ